MSKNNHPSTSSAPKKGILIVNLGTPESLSYWDIRRYLSEFLNDIRVVDLSRWVWPPILYTFILTLRPFKTQKAYAKIWNKEKNESPLKTTTRSQAEKLQTKVGKETVVDWAMRYGQPDIRSKIQNMCAQGVRELTILPLYPQYAGATTGSVMDAVARTIPTLKFVPTLKTVAPYYDDSDYINLLAQSVEKNIKKKPPQVLVCSFHGLPVRYCKEGDPYYCHCHKTARLLAEKLGWHFVNDWREQEIPTDKPTLLLTFQSVFGKEVWLQPYTDETLAFLAQKGLKNIAIITPGFAADCVETLEEIAIEGRNTFMENGGNTLTVIPCLNDSDEHIKLLKKLTT
ncbi:MAG: ferrochelatase [Alphaproteobacteria bacterium]|nr:ferrochelatase [Alphaproteobacteria bacterium]MDD9919142.1 ferrochelatase [Alphaproteobacteria bacterium]